MLGFNLGRKSDLKTILKNNCKKVFENSNLIEKLNFEIMYFEIF